MAGEIDEHIDLQAKHLPTGSVSFGRFETESLSWERRSSFSHNRYLEEVEKYSTPGSVTQKKAYFEAHFKKKGGLFHQISSASQFRSEDRIAEIDTVDHLNCMDEYDRCYEGETLGEFQNHINDGVQFCWYDESPVLSDEIKYEIRDGEGDEVTSVPQLILDPIIPDELTEMDMNSQVTGCAKMDQIQECNADLVRNSSQHDFGDVELQSAANKEADREGTFESKDAFTVDSQVEATDASPSKRKNKISHVEENLEPQVTKTKHKPRSTTHTMQRSSTEKITPSSLSSSKKMGRNTGIGPLLKSKPQKQFVARASSATVSKNIKCEDSQNANAKFASVDNSSKSFEKDKPKKSAAVPQCAKGIRSSSANHSSNRLSRVTESVKSNLKAAGTVFNFRSDERAEKRKEFYVKLEEKHHTKVVQINEIQEKTKEEMETKMKQFRRSLNFKATPMPTFYHEVAQKHSSVKKAPTRSPTQAKYLSPSSKTIPQISSPTVSTAAVDPVSILDDACASNACPSDLLGTPKHDSSARCQVGGVSKPTVVAYNAGKSKMMKACKKDESSNGRMQGDCKTKKDERARSISAIKTMRSNSSRASPAIHVAS